MRKSRRYMHPRVKGANFQDRVHWRRRSQRLNGGINSVAELFLSNLNEADLTQTEYDAIIELSTYKTMDTWLLLHRFFIHWLSDGVQSRTCLITGQTASYGTGTSQVAGGIRTDETVDGYIDMLYEPIDIANAAADATQNSFWGCYVGDVVRTASSAGRTIMGTFVGNSQLTCRFVAPDDLLCGHNSGSTQIQIAPVPANLNGLWESVRPNTVTAFRTAALYQNGVESDVTTALELTPSSQPMILGFAPSGGSDARSLDASFGLSYMGQHRSDDTLVEWDSEDWNDAIVQLKSDLGK